jgi:hypothetical protein
MNKKRIHRHRLQDPWWASCHCQERRTEYCGNFDAYFCMKCYSWLESKCGSQACDSCVERPPYNVDFARKDLTEAQQELKIIEDLESFFGPRNCRKYLNQI